MIKLGSYCAVLKDKTGYPIASLIGELEFIFGSYKKSIQDANVDKDVRELIENGSINFVKVYGLAVDDNDVKLNVAKERGVNLSIPTQDVLSMDISSKDFTKKHKTLFAMLNSEARDLIKEVLKAYENGKQESFRKVFDVKNS